MKTRDNSFEKAAEKFRKEISGRVEERVLMKRYTSFRIGGLCELMVAPSGADELSKVIEYCEKQGLPWKIIGRGSNLLVLDEGLEMVLVNLQDALKKIEQTNENIIRAEAGVRLSRLVKFCQEAGLAGMEWATGIPGTVGGAIRMNAGAERRDMHEVLKSVEFYRWPEGRFTRNRNELKMSYRKFELAPKEIILGAELQLAKDEPSAIKERISGLLRKRRMSQPVSYPSAGSVFKNPPGNFAGKLIEEVGLKGFRSGDAQVSEVHANFIVNRGRAKAKHVLDLIGIIKDKVKQEKGVDLELEIEIVGESK